MAGEQDGWEDSPHRRRWNKKKCKRNKGKPHEFEFVDDFTFTYRVIGDETEKSVTWQNWACVHCGKKEMIRI